MLVIRLPTNYIYFRLQLKQLERCLRYVEETHRNLKSAMSPELRHTFENFCRALAMRFPNYIEFAQPAQFWQKYRSSKTAKGGRKKRRRMDDDEEDDSEDDTQSESDSDNEMPLERHKPRQPDPVCPKGKQAAIC